MSRYIDMENALKQLNKDDLNIEDLPDEIPEIQNPYPKGSEEYQGFETAIATIIQNLFGEDENPKISKRKLDPRMEKPPASKNMKPAEERDEEDEKEEASKGDGESSNSVKPAKWTKKEIEDLYDRIEKNRDSSNDYIDDEGKLKNKETDNNKEQNNINNKNGKAEGPQSDANNNSEAGLEKMPSYWDNEKLAQAKQDIANKQIEKQLDAQSIKSHKNTFYSPSTRRDYKYKALTINQIVNDIVNTVKAEVSNNRQYSWSRYNPRNDDPNVGRLAPGRYTTKNKKVPQIWFYFDVSGSWYGDEEKIDMGHRIAEGLKELDKKGKIKLVQRWFGSKVHTAFTENDQNNSAEPLPDIAQHLANKEIDNLIIMTDDNPEGYTGELLEIPGVYWGLFYDTVSDECVASVKGKKKTNIYMIKH